MKQLRKDKGEVMLEGMIVMVMTMFLLIWILAVGFMYYQRYLVTAVTNDAAVKIAATYNNPDSDLIMGYITAEDLAERDLYRGFTDGSLHNVNENKADAYITYTLEKTNFSGTIQDVDTSLKLVHDSVVRKHVEIETKCTFNTPFGEIFNVFGMNRQATYQAIARADCTDLIDYYSTVSFASFLGSDEFIKTEFSSISSSVIGMVKSCIDLFNHFYTGT